MPSGGQSTRKQLEETLKPLIPALVTLGKIVTFAAVALGFNLKAVSR